MKSFSKRILINCITLDSANLIPLLSKVKYWESQGCECTFFCNNVFRRRVSSYEHNIHKFIKFENEDRFNNKMDFIWKALKRNFHAISYIGELKGKYDVIYSVSSVMDLIIFPFFFKLADKNIAWVTVFDNVVPLRNPGNRLIRFLAWLFFQMSLFFLKKSDVIFAISKDLKQFLIRNGFSEERIVLTGNAIEAGTIKQSAKDMRYSIDALFVGRINEAKGIYDMLRVLEIVKRKYPEFQLAIMGRGDGRTEHKFQKKIQKMGLKSNVQFLGYKIATEKFAIIKSSKCFWFLSLSESFGISLLEAVCCGLPAFAYDLPAYRHIYTNNEVTILEKNNYLKVAEQVIDLFNKGDFINKNGKELLERYSWDAIAEIECNSF